MLLFLNPYNAGLRAQASCVRYLLFSIPWVWGIDAQDVRADECEIVFGVPPSPGERARAPHQLNSFFHLTLVFLNNQPKTKVS